MGTEASPWFLTVGQCLASGGAFGWWRVAVQDLPAVGAAGLGGAVGVEGELPASSVDADVVVVLAEQDEVVE